MSKLVLVVKYYIVLGAEYYILIGAVVNLRFVSMFLFFKIGCFSKIDIHQNNIKIIKQNKKINIKCITVVII